MLLAQLAQEAGDEPPADVSNIFQDMPRTFGNSIAREYSPAWDLQVGVFSDAAVAKGENGLKTDAADILRLAARGVVTAPGGLPLGFGERRHQLPRAGVPRHARPGSAPPCRLL